MKTGTIDYFDGRAHMALRDFHAPCPNSSDLDPMELAVWTCTDGTVTVVFGSRLEEVLCPITKRGN